MCMVWQCTFNILYKWTYKQKHWFGKQQYQLGGIMQHWTAVIWSNLAIGYFTYIHTPCYTNWALVEQIRFPFPKLFSNHHCKRELIQYYHLIHFINIYFCIYFKNLYLLTRCLVNRIVSLGRQGILSFISSGAPYIHTFNTRYNLTPSWRAVPSS